MILPPRDLEHVLDHMPFWKRLRNKRIFLTGASGFVGTWLSESFEWANRRLELHSHLTKIPRTSLPAGGFEFGIHAAKADSFLADMNGTRRILDFASERGVNRFLFTSSGAVYGKLPPGMTNVTEEFLCTPETSYAQAKFAGEQLCAEYRRFCSVIARMFTFAGPALPLNANFAIGNFVRDVIDGGPVILQGDGRSRRSYLYAADLAVWLWTLLLEGEHARPYNVGSPHAISIYDLAQTVVSHTKPSTPIVVLSDPRSDVYVPSVERARRELNLRPFISLPDGIRRMYAWNLAAKKREMALTRPTTS